MSKIIKRILYYALMAIFCAVFIACAVHVVRYLIEVQRSEDLMSSLASMYTTAPTQQTEPTLPPTTAPTVPTESTGPDQSDPTQPTQPTLPPPTEPQIRDEIKGIYEMNNDVVGWIKVDGTDINISVLQSPYQQSFYLNHNFNKEPSVAGWIYVREACDVDRPSDNITIYGHNMANGSMFGQLARYRKGAEGGKAFYEQNKYIQFDTLYECHTYEIIAVFGTSGTYGVGYPYHLFETARNEEEFNEFVNSCRALNLYDIPTTAEYGDKLITLSTCWDNIDNGRLVIVAKRIN